MKEICLSPSGKKIPYLEGESILTSLEKFGLIIPNNCRAGACGECKMKINSGEIDQGFILDMALSAEEKAKGFALLCMAKQKSSTLELDWQTTDATPKLFPPMEHLEYMLLEKITATPKIVKLKFKALKTPLRFWPGQYVQLKIESNGIKLPLRSYSIANIPNNDGELVLFVTKEEGGIVSTFLHDELKIGAKILINGPYGHFIGDPSSERSVLCLTQGSGLAPILSLAQGAMFRGGFRNPATILFSVRDETEVFEKGIVSYLETKFRNFKFIITYTQSENSSSPIDQSNSYLKSNKPIGRITSILPELYPDLLNYDVYIAGSPRFVLDCKEVAIQLNAPPSRIFLESFTTQSH